jgi:phosphoribosyl-ATP pyrophosphohydrolase/phosphoribosyl-AMP cyclohydrolase
MNNEVMNNEVMNSENVTQVDLDFGKLDGLLAVVIQDAKTQRVLMVGFMNAEAYARTLETGFVVFFSRSRNKLWMKGETSGHTLQVVSMSTDCDRDALLISVNAAGPGVTCNAVVDDVSMVGAISDIERGFVVFSDRCTQEGR